ncbi:MAG: NIPSNAP family protein [Burkholderiaceae bacterium]
MIHELRVYRALPGRMPALLKRFETKTVKIWERMGIRPVGFWTTMIGPSHLELVYLLAWESLEERQRQWDAFQADPEWQQAWADSEKDGIIVGNVASSLLSPTKFSALR